MDDEFDTFTFHHVFFAVFAIMLGWGVFWAGNQGAKVAFVNSGIISFDQSAAVGVTSNDTTQSGASAQDNSGQTLTIRIGGDVMFDRQIRLLAKENGYDSLLSGVASLFRTADISVVNLEGPITSYISKTLLADGKTTKSFTFTFDPASSVALSNAGISLVSLANNHTDNFGMAGLIETKKWLFDAGVGWFGSPWNGTSTEAVISKNGVSVAFVGYHAFQKGIDRILADIKRISDEGNFVIVMPHWGEEYTSAPSDDLRAKAELFVAAGADAIIGAHPHVIMEQEWVKGVPVYYSLGNLLFDQYFSTAVMTGNIVELQIVKNAGETKIDSLRIYEISLDSRKGPRLSDDTMIE